MSPEAVRQEVGTRITSDPHLGKNQNNRQTGTHLIVRGNVPDGDRVVLHVFVDGQIRRLVNFGRF